MFKLTEYVIVWKKGTDFSIEIDHLLVDCDKRGVCFQNNVYYCSFR